MRLALLQLNARLADPEGNGRALEAAYAEAVHGGADLVLAPELAVVGYLAKDRLWEPGLRRRVLAESHRLAGLTGEIPFLLGTCSPAPSGRLWNELWWCEKGGVRQVARKRALPSYDIFDELRWFEPGPDPAPLVDYRGWKIGLSICEDLWTDEEFTNAPLHYGVDIIAEQARAGATLLVNASASPAYLGSWHPDGPRPEWAVASKHAQRMRLLKGLAAKHGLPVAYAGRTGAESWLLFDGGTGFVHPEGGWQGLAPFEEGICFVETDTAGGICPEPSESEWLRRALRVGLQQNLVKQGLEAVVVGLSGGIDSAVVAAVAAEALGPERVLGVALPTRHSSRESHDLAKAEALHLGIPFLSLEAERPFAGAVSALEQAFPDRAFSLTDENLQSRSRGLLLMALTTEPAVHERLGSSRVAVLNTGNKSEAATGYFTLYGDGIGAFGLLGDCLKARVYGLARELGAAIPRGVLERPPTAELRPGQTDEASLLPYRQLDAILGAHLEAGRPEEALADDLAQLLVGEDLVAARAALPRVLRLLRSTEFKRRQLPFAMKVSPKAFGAGRRIPLTAL